MNAKKALILLLCAAFTVLTLVWVTPVVGIRNSACEQQPYSANCR